MNINIEELAEQSANQLRDLIRDAGRDIEALVEQCGRESVRQERKILPRVGFSITIELPKVAVALSYGVRVKRESIIEMDDPDQLPLPVTERKKK